MDEKSGYGLIFLYKNHKLSASKLVAIDDEIVGKGNPEDVYVVCKSCDQYMTYDKEYYICKKCGARLKESTVLKKLDEENDTWIKNMDFDEPECCIACGGPYPDCVSSCKLCN